MGYDILCYNYRCRRGEIDIVAKDGDCLVFCEVKYRSDEKKGMPLEAVDRRKQNIIFYCAMHYISEYNIGDVPCRFDVIGITGRKIIHLKNAFEG